jgi:hypothetical protein
MPKFVVLTHDFPILHWDFMLEKEAGLRTWRLAAPPDTAGEIAATPLADHRLAYLDYEGPVSANRGTVTRWDRGEFVILVETSERIEVVLQGTRLKGRAVLRGTGEGWSFRFAP